MKSKNGFVVAYNVQAAVDSEMHMIEDYLVTDQVTNHGLIGTVVTGIKEKARDMAACLKNGIISDVMPPEGEDTYELEIPYEDMGNGIDMAEKPDRRKRSLRAGKGYFVRDPERNLVY